MSRTRVAAIIVAAIIVLSIAPIGILTGAWGEGENDDLIPNAMNNADGAEGDAPEDDNAGAFLGTFNSIVTVTSAKLLRDGEDGEEVRNNEEVSFNESLKIEYLFRISKEQSDAIKAAITADPATYTSIPIPTGLAWPHDIGETELDANGEKFADIWAEGGIAYIKFIGDFWNDPGSIENGWLEMECKLDKNEIGDTAESYKIDLIDNVSLTILIKENQLTEHALEKSGVFENNRFKWTVTYTPGTTATTYPLTLKDTFDNTVHILVPNSIEINGVSVNDGIVATASNYTTISYEILEKDKDKAVTITYETRLSDSQLTADPPSDSKATNTVELWEDVDKDVITSTTTSVTAGSDKKRWIGKNGAQNDRSVTWTVNINTLDRDLTNLVMYDAVPDWLNPPTGVTVTTKDGVPVSSNQYTFSTATDAQEDGSSFCVKFTNPPYPADGYIVTYITEIKNEYFDESKRPNVNNEAWLTFDWLKYDGSGPSRIRTLPSIDTAFTGDTNVIQKKAIEYNPATHKITWEVIVNPYTVNIASATITDALIDYGQKYAGGFSSSSPLLTTDSSDGDDTLIVNVGALGTATSTFTFDSYVIDENDYAGNHKGKKYENVVEFDGKLADGNHITDFATAWIIVESEMLSKKSIGYNYNTHEVTWQLTINQNTMAMKNPTIVDTLPAGLSYVDGSVSGAAGVTASFNSPTLTISFPNTSDTVIITYRTKVDTDAIGEFKSADKVTVKNSASLSHDGFIDLASATSSRAIDNKFLNKHGQYSNGIISFSVNINVNQVTVTGSPILTDAISSSLQLDVTSVKLWEATVASNGTFTPKGAQANYSYDSKVDGELVFDYTKLLSDNKFSFALPVGNEQYILTYDCFITGHEPYENAVELTGCNITGKPATDHCSVSVAAGGGGSSSKAARLIIEKVDGLRTGVKLDGVKFELYRRFEGSVLDDMKIAEATTNAQGVAEFYPLVLNTTYVLKEVSTKSGYNPAIVNVSSVPSNNINIGKVNGQSNTYEVKVSAQGNYTLTVTNAPKTANLSFTKYSNWSSEPSVPLAGAEFTITDQTANSSYTKTAISGSDGIVSFVDVPFGTYLVTESVVPANHSAHADFTVTIDESGRITEFDGQINPSGNLIVVNNGKTTKLEITKVEGSTPMQDVRFTLYREKTAGLWTEVSSTLTDSSGKATFNNLLVGEQYRIAETAPTGYYQPEDYVFTAENIAAHEFEWKNYPLDGKITINKTEYGSGKKLNGVKYELYDEADVLVATAVTDSAGVAVFDRFPLEYKYTMDASNVYTATFTDKNYEIREITPYGYYPCKPLTATATTTNQDIDWKNYPGVGVVSLRVRDIITGNPLEGAEYGIYDKNDTLIATATSNPVGTLIFFNLPLNTTKPAEYDKEPEFDPDDETEYTIREIHNIPGYDPISDVSLIIKNNDPNGDEDLEKSPTPPQQVAPVGGSGAGIGGTGGGTGNGGSNPASGTTADSDEPGDPVDPDEEGSGMSNNSGGSNSGGSSANNPLGLVTFDEIKNISDVPTGDILQSNQLPTGYKLVYLRDNIYIIYDESGTALGYIALPKGMKLEEYDILGNMIAFNKTNPKTGDRSRSYFPLFAMLVVSLASGGVALVSKRKRS